MTSTAKRGGLWWRPSGPSLTDRWLLPSLKAQRQAKDIILPQKHTYQHFEERQMFKFDQHLSGCPSHTSRDAERLLRKLKGIDAVIEVRDARVPLTSANYYLYEKLPPKMKRIVVLNKVDLVTPRAAEKACQLIKASKLPCIQSSAINSQNVIKIKETILKEIQPKFKTIGIWVMFIGLPNTGKSSLVNALKRMSFAASKHGHKGNKSIAGVKPTQARSGPLPGLTQQLQHFMISSSPKFFCLDTPGVMVPKLSDEQQNMKLAALGCVLDWKFGEMYIADWILFFLNKRRNFLYVSILGLKEPTNDIKIIASLLTQRLKSHKLDIGGESLSGCRYFIQLFREGYFGKHVLDDLPEIEDILLSEDAGTTLQEPPGPWGPASFPSAITGL